MDFINITTFGSVTMGTPSTLTSTTTNAVTATSHTHAITNYALNGTDNQITITGAGKVLGAATTLSLPQNIHTGAGPTFLELTLSSLTQGSVLFAGVNGLLSQDNSNFYWNNTSNMLGVGTNNPQNTLNVEGDANVTQTMYIGSARVFTNGNGDMIFRI